MAKVAGWLALPALPILGGSFLLLAVVTDLLPRWLRNAPDRVLGLALWSGVLWALLMAHLFLDLSDKTESSIQDLVVAPRLQPYGNIRVDGVQLMNSPEMVTKLHEPVTLPEWRGLDVVDRRGREGFVRAIFESENGGRLRVTIEMSYDMTNPEPRLYARFVQGSVLTQSGQELVKAGDPWEKLQYLTEKESFELPPENAEGVRRVVLRTRPEASEPLVFEGRKRIESITIVHDTIIADEFQEWLPLLSIDDITLGNSLESVQEILTSTGREYSQADGKNPRILWVGETKLTFRRGLLDLVEGSVLKADGQPITKIGEAPPQAIPGLERSHREDGEKATDVYRVYGRRVLL